MRDVGLIIYRLAAIHALGTTTDNRQTDDMQMTGRIGLKAYT